MMKKLGLEPFVHGLFWICLIGGEVYSLSILTERHSSLGHYFFFYLLNISLFYSYVWLLYRIPKKRTLEAICAMLVFIFEITVYVLLAAVLTRYLNSISNQGTRIMAFDQKFYVSTIWRGVYFMIFATGYYLIKRHAKQREIELEKEIEVEKLRNELIVTEKNFLKSQINPHLLFNTIIFIKHAIKHDPANAALALTGLSEIMDYALSNSKRDSVMLSEEVEQIENMISLNRLRFGKKLELTFSKRVENPGDKIIPIVLLTIVENVFKHANLTDRSHPINIVLECSSSKLTFKTSNLPSNDSLSKGTQTGLENIKQRLKASYPSRHTFSYGIGDGLFVTDLTITL